MMSSTYIEIINLNGKINLTENVLINICQKQIK